MDPQSAQQPVQPLVEQVPQQVVQPIQESAQPVLQQTPQPMQPPMQKSSKSSSKFLFSLLVLFLVIGSAAGGYFLANTKKTANITPNSYIAPAPVHNANAQITPAITPVSSQSAIINTSSWKTYQSKGYSIQYPSTWLLMSTDSAFGTSGNAVWVFNPVTMKEGYGNGGYTGLQVPSQFVVIDQTLSTQTAKQYVDAIVTKESSIIPGLENAMDIKGITIGTLSGESYIEPGEGSRGRLLVVSNGRVLFIFNISTNDPSQDAVIKGILSTFSSK